jgi:NAD(P)-dependent dehydrogenase (short-subunit alcohol dehydrogenase family)
MDLEFEGQVALVTAAAGAGIGQAAARRLAAGGAVVVVTDVHERRTKEVTEALRDEHGNRVVGYQMDAGDRRRCEKVVADVLATRGPIDILVNNAAVNIIKSIWDISYDDWDRVIEVDLTGAWNLSRLAMRHMRDAGGGVIVNVSSLAPDCGGNGIESPYACAKGGMNVLTRSCAHEGGPYNIRVNSVVMSMIEGTKFALDHPDITEQIRASAPLGRLPNIADIAECIAFLCSARANCITGETINVSGGAMMRY